MFANKQNINCCCRNHGFNWSPIYNGFEYILEMTAFEDSLIQFGLSFLSSAKMSSHEVLHIQRKLVVVSWSCIRTWKTFKIILLWKVLNVVLEYHGSMSRLYLHSRRITNSQLTCIEEKGRWRVWMLYSYKTSSNYTSYWSRVGRSNPKLPDKITWDVWIEVFGRLWEVCSANHGPQFLECLINHHADVFGVLTNGMSTGFPVSLEPSLNSDKS